VDEQRMRAWGIGIAIAAGGWLLGWLVRVVMVPLIRRLVSRSSTRLDDAVFASLGPHVPVWFLVLGVVVGSRYAPISVGVRHVVDRGATAVVILSASLAVASFVGHLLDRAAKHWMGTSGATSLAQNVVRGTIVTVGLLAMLGQLGVSVTPLLTALGLGSLGVALGLQPTLTNLFAGFQITLSRQMRVGDFIELDNGMQGFVEDIGWRSVQLRELSSSRVVVPNARLAEMVVRNHSLPGDELGFIVPLLVAHGTDLGAAERVALEAARDVQREVVGGVPAFEPAVRFTAYTDSGIQMNVALRARTVTDRFLLTSELLRRVLPRFAGAGIEIPVVQRIVGAQRAASPPIRTD
jgi:small-conductance mechanosensitive channel